MTSKPTDEQQPAADQPSEQQPSEQQPSATGDSEQIHADIDRTRDELGHTVEALAEKADVKDRAKKAAGMARAQAREKIDAGVQQAAGSVSEVTDRVRQRPMPAAAGIAAAGAAAVAAGTILALRRRRAAKARARRGIWRLLR